MITDGTWTVGHQRCRCIKALRSTLFTGVMQERRKKEREVEEKRMAAERAAEDERRKAAEVQITSQCCNIALCFAIIA